MLYKPLGKSELQISAIGFGCMSLGGREPDNEWLIHQAMAVGINFFDTADLYERGLNEEQLGRILRGRRDEVVLATKVGNRWRENCSGWDWDPRKEYIMNAVEDSLRRLGTDRIDLYQLHGGTTEDPIDETIEAFALLQQQGKIRYYGISSIRPNVIREWVARSSMVSVMVQYNLLDRRPEENIFPLLRGRDIGILARGPLAKGLLVDKPAVPYLDHTTESVENAAKLIHSHSGKKRLAAQTALQFVLSEEAVTSAVTGIRTPEQLAAAVGVMEAEWLTAGELAELRTEIPADYYREHR